MACLALGLGPGPADATPSLERFYLGGARVPSEPVLGSDGAVWVTTLSGLARIAPDGSTRLHRTGKLTPFSLAAGPDGALWFTDLDGKRVGQMDTTGRMRVVAHAEFTDAHLFEIASGADGHLWLVDELGGRILRLSVDGQVAVAATLGLTASVRQLSAGTDGAVWFAYDEGVGRISPQGTLQLMPLVNVGALTAGPDGNAWAADGTSPSLMRIAPDGTVTRIAIGRRATDLTAGPDGFLWFTTSSGVGRVALDGSNLTQWREPFGAGNTTGGLAFDAAGNLWAADSDHDSMLRLTPAATAGSPLRAIARRGGTLRDARTLASAPDGTVWMTARRALVRIEGSGRRSVFRRGVGRPTSVLPTANGAVWFTFGGRGIARLSLDGRVRRFTRGFPDGARPSTLALGPRRSVWFLDASTPNAIGRMTRSGRVRIFRRGLGPRPDLLTITRGPDRRMWVTDQRGAILAVSGSGRVTRYTRGLGRRPSPTAITAGPDGNLWFTQFTRRRIGRITPAGNVSLWSTRDYPGSIIAGPDRALWFTTAGDVPEETLSGVARLSLDGQIDEFFVRATSFTGYQSLANGPNDTLWFLPRGGPIALASLDVRSLRALGQLPRP